MNLFSNYSTRAKLLLGFGLMLAFLISVSAVAYRDTARLKASQTELFENDLSIAFNLISVRNVINRERVTLLSMALADEAQLPALATALEQQTKEMAVLVSKLEKQKRIDVVLEQNLQKMSELRKEFITIRDRDVMPLLKAGKRSEAGKAIIGPLQDKFQTIREIATTAGDQQLADAEARMRDASAIVKNAQATLFAANLIAIALGLVLVVWLDRVIARPLKQATLAAQRIATGDLTGTVPAAAGNDEVGQLLRALAAMVDAWKHLMQETNAGIVTLSAAASEIASSTMQTAGNAAETAAAVSETTATVEEVKQTAILASQKARTVSDAAQRAAQTADAGRTAVQNGLAGMESVQQQMDSIAETIVRLSERSQDIAEIIATVSGLAEQSNLLAVNAAIEAAKAGEHGRGFGVVAKEVKDLADQSRQATKQVRIILGEIQKAVSSTVMTAEQGSRTVAIGVEQTTQAGIAIKSLADSAADSAQVAAQIAATSQQQLAGMDQVAFAMENIKQASAENAAGLRQAEASAQNLHELGQKLKLMSERFKL